MSATPTSPDTRRKTILGAGLLAGGANVIMQLAMPAVGYGVVESTVDNGNLYEHPVKRTRTTLTYLAVAMLGTDEERAAYRRAVDRQHRHVRSGPSSPVRYHAMDPHLQRWVAACLYKGVEDVYRAFVGEPDPATTDELYRHSAALGTTLQVRPEMWPADRAAFERYWKESLSAIDIDDTVREHLLGIARLRMFPRPVSLLFGRFNAFVTTGFLPPQFRERMRLDWSPRHQRRFDRLMRLIGTTVLRLPRPLREFPYNASLWDLRRRLRRGAPLV
ncbi:oxygenase MpaB family protein [Saccharomonospora halophila]|uniref:oxygenase MpaB family protein n=1 Tax=Saccharomonospora halophila TaxID=129922 RepID=UPI0003664A50|nr:oxygenase MpaB family protein [Saccharomonospora halophila]